MLAVIGTNNEIKLLINELYVIFCLRQMLIVQIICMLNLHIKQVLTSQIDYAGCVLKCDDV